MFSAILILLAMPFSDLAKLRGIQFKPLKKTFFFIFIGNLLLLMVLGAKHVESPYIEFGQITTLIYFVYFLLQIPMNSLFENSISEFYTNCKSPFLRAKDKTLALYDRHLYTNSKSPFLIAIDKTLALYDRHLYFERKDLDDLRNSKASDKLAIFEVAVNRQSLHVSIERVYINNLLKLRSNN